MPSINLAPGTQYIIAARKRRIRLYAIAGVIVVIFTLAWGSLTTYEESLMNIDTDIQTKIQTANAKIQTLHDDAVRVALFEKRLVEVKNLLDTHSNWEPVFKDLERLLPADTVLNNLAVANDSSTITLQGTTAQVDQISLAIASLTAGESHPSVFQSGSVKNVQRQEQNTGNQVSVVHSFTLTVIFDPKVLWQ